MEAYIEKYNDKHGVETSEEKAQFRKHMERTKAIKTEFRFLLFDSEFYDDFLMGYNACGRRDGTGLRIGFAGCC